MKSIQKYIDKIENGHRQEYFIKGDKLKSITEAMKEACIPGISVAIIHNYEVVMAKGYGVADIETCRPVDTNTLFQAASISKALTAMAVMKLVQEGKLDLDENINTYLKTWKLVEGELTAKNKVTLRNLLSHTAGATCHGFPGYSADEEVPTLVQVLNGESPANTGKIFIDMEPNTSFRYSGGGYTIVQQVLIDQLGRPFEKTMQELVLEPLGMSSSFYSNLSLNEKQCANATAGHKMDGSQVRLKRHRYPEMAAAGLWTTAEDLAKVAIEVQKCLKGKSNKIISKEFMEIMTTPILNGEYNIGFCNEKIGGAHFIGHHGGNEGYSCCLLFSKDKGFGFVFMSNSDNGYKMKRPFLRSAAATYEFPDILYSNCALEDISEHKMKSFVGNYKMQPDKSLKVYMDTDKLFYKTIFEEPIQLNYVGDNTFIDAGRNSKLKFKEDYSSLFMNEAALERLNDGEKLASDYIEEDNLEQAVNFYHELIENDTELRFSLENTLNNDGYNCIFRENYKAGIGILKINTMLYPESSNTWDSLGEAYFMSKQYELCINAMKKSLKFNPNNQNAVKLMKEAEKRKQY